jgi:peptidoglycan/LPS O-acetylase OafA/YrhL
MKHWWPERAYKSKPYVAISVGALSVVGSIVASVVRGDWGLLALVCGLGGAFLIYGGVILQLRSEYRRRSKWARHDGQRHDEPRD